MDAELGEEARNLDERPLVLLERFHGHLGPYVVLGYRAGKLAQDTLGANAFKLTADVFTGHEPPVSCFADGVQMGSGCTLGKNNITIHDKAKAEALFRSKDGRTLRARVTPSVIDRIRLARGLPGLAEVSEWIMGQGAEELFEITK
jgi:formylmethanofuran dehydrogenase subunit E